MMDGPVLPIPAIQARHVLRVWWPGGGGIYNGNNQYSVVILLQPVGATQNRGPQNNCSTTTGRPARHADLQVVVLLAQPLS